MRLNEQLHSCTWYEYKNNSWFGVCGAKCAAAGLHVSQHGRCCGNPLFWDPKSWYKSILFEPIRYNRVTCSSTWQIRNAAILVASNKECEPLYIEEYAVGCLRIPWVKPWANFPKWLYYRSIDPAWLNPFPRSSHLGPHWHDSYNPKIAVKSYENCLLE